MKNTIYNTYKLFHQSSEQTFFSYCVSFKNDDTKNRILLQNPQIIYSLSLDKENYSLQSSTIALDASFIDVNSNTKQTVNSYVKFEKKNKNNFPLDDETDNKKNKIASKKKKRNKLSLNQDDFFVDDSSMEAGANNLRVDLIKPVKSRRQKKKHGVKQDSFTHQVTDNSIINHIQPDESYSKNNKEIVLDAPLTIKQLANQLNVSEASIITWLFLQGISVTINQMVDISIAIKVAEHYNFTVLDSSNSQSVHSVESPIVIANLKQAVKRAPIITIFGHVDHGKTSLLDYIRKTNVVNKEAGGITQSITGYEVNYNYINDIEKLIFLDTPGHEAFTSMRLRGFEVTDIAILLVAADDGLKPQSIEAINHIMSRRIPYIVAINKIDKLGIHLDKIRDQLSKYGIVDEQLGGSSNIVYISALTGLNVDTLLSKICQLSNSLNLKAGLQNQAEGMIIESYLNKKTGPVATVVLKNGTLRVGDVLVSGNTYGKVKTITSSNGMKISSANSASMLQICGFSSVPQTGLKFCVVDDEKKAKSMINQNIDIKEKYEHTKLLNTRVTLESYNNDTNLKTVNLIVKADTQGSIEAIIHAFSQIPQDKVQINIISCGSSSVFDKDIDLAITSQSIILCFNVSIATSIRNSAEKSNIIIKDFKVIYHLLDYVKQYMLNLVTPEYDKIAIGEATVQTVFYMNKGTVAGCFVNSGILQKGCYIIAYRNNIIVYEGILSSLKRLKDNVDEVIAGNECGVMSANYALWQKLDRIEAFEIIQKEKIL